MATKQKSATATVPAAGEAGIAPTPRKRKSAVRRKPVGVLKEKQALPVPRPVRRQHRPAAVKRPLVPVPQKNREELARVEAEGAAILVLTVVLLTIILIVGGFLYLSFSL